MEKCPPTIDTQKAIQDNISRCFPYFIFEIYICYHMKKKVSLFIFIILCNSHAQSISSSSNTRNVNISSRSEPACATQSIPGMQYSKTVHYVYKGYLFDKAINLQGFVNNVTESEALVLDRFSIEPKSKIIQLKNVTIETRHDYDSSTVSF